MADFPGILIIETLKGPAIFITDGSGEVGSWKYEDLCRSPKLFMECLNTLMNTVKYGPTSARQLLKDSRNPPLSDGHKVCCNVCHKEFLIEKGVFQTSLNTVGQVILEYQCSKECYESRRSKLDSKESRNGFLRKLKEIYQKPVSS